MTQTIFTIKQLDNKQFYYVQTDWDGLWPTVTTISGDFRYFDDLLVEVANSAREGGYQFSVDSKVTGQH